MYLNVDDFILLTACCAFLILLRVFRETPEVGRGRARQGAWPPEPRAGRFREPGGRFREPGAGPRTLRRSWSSGLVCPSPWGPGFGLGPRRERPCGPSAS